MSQQLFTAHLLSSPRETQELRGFLLEGVAASDAVFATAPKAARFRFLSSGSPPPAIPPPGTVLPVDANKDLGLGPVYDTGTGSATVANWRRFSAPYVTALGVYVDFPLGDKKLLSGNANGQASVINRSGILLNELGSPSGPVSFGGQLLNNVGYPVVATDGVNKQYVLDVVSGNVILDPAKLISNQALPGTWAYSTVSKTLTRTSGTSALTATEIDTGAVGAYAYTLLTNDRVLINNQTGTPGASYNGVYVVSNIGGATNAVLTRAVDADSNAELLSPFVFITNGSAVGSGYQQNSAVYDITVPSGTINFVQVSDATTYTAGNGIDIDGTRIHFYSKTGWTTGALFYGNSSTALTHLPIDVAGRFLQSTGSYPRWSFYTLPATGSEHDVLSFGPSVLGNVTGVTVVSGRGNNKVMVTNETGVPRWHTDLPAGTTIGGENPVIGTSIISLAKGGTGKDNSPNPTSTPPNGTLGGVAFRDSASTISVGIAPLATGSNHVKWDSTPATGFPNGRVVYHDLYSASITWTGTHIFRSDLNLIADNAAVGTQANSPVLRIEGNANVTGTFYRSRWEIATDIANNDAEGPLRISQKTDAVLNPDTDPAFAFHSNSDSNYPGGFELTTGSAIITWGGNLLFNNRTPGGARGLYQLPVSGDTALYTDYSAATAAKGGTLTLAALELGQVWKGKQLHYGALADFVFGVKVAGDAFDRLLIRADGQIWWGAGAGATDVSLIRVTGGLSTNGLLNVGAAINAAGATFTTPLGLPYGGTGNNLATGQAQAGGVGGVTYRYNAISLGVSAAPTISRQVLLGNTTAGQAPTWTNYTIPSASFTAAGALLKSATTTSMDELIAPADTTTRFLTSTNRVLAWNAGTTPARSVTGVARIFSAMLQGTGVNTSFNLTHNFGTRDVSITVRKAASAEDDVTGYDQVITSCQVLSTNAVRIQFGYFPAATEYFVVTIVG